MISKTASAVYQSFLTSENFTLLAIPAKNGRAARNMWSRTLTLYSATMVRLLLLPKESRPNNFFLPYKGLYMKLSKSESCNLRKDRSKSNRDVKPKSTCHRKKKIKWKPVTQNRPEKKCIRKCMMTKLESKKKEILKSLLKKNWVPCLQKRDKLGNAMKEDSSFSLNNTKIQIIQFLLSAFQDI